MRSSVFFDGAEAGRKVSRFWVLLSLAAVIAAAGVTNVTARLLIGDILEMAAKSEADAEMIVIGKRGEAADFARGHLGSNLERVVRGAPVGLNAAVGVRYQLGPTLVLDAGASMALDDSTGLELSYSGQIASDAWDQGLKLTLTVAF